MTTTPERHVGKISCKLRNSYEIQKPVERPGSVEVWPARNKLLGKKGFSYLKKERFFFIWNQTVAVKLAKRIRI